MKLSPTILFALILLTSCDTDELLGKISMGDVHMTDENGSPIGGGSDNDEWQLDTPIDERIEAYFDIDKSICDVSGTSIFFPAYPNPASGNIAFSFTLDKVREFKFIIVDNCYEVFIEIDKTTYSNGSHTYALDLFNLTAGETYRMFYQFADEECVLMGYGDIRKA